MKPRKHTYEIPNPIPHPHSPEQGAAYSELMMGKPVAVDSCAGSGKSFLARSAGVNYNGRVETVPFMKSLAEAERNHYKGFPNVNVSHFHQRGFALCHYNQRAEVDRDKLERLAFGYDNEAFKAIAKLAGHFKTEAVGIYELALSPDEIAVKYSIDKKHVPDALKVLAESDAMHNIIDETDMLRLPVLQGRKELLEGLIILDEVQDYTPAAWVFLRECLTSPKSHVLMIGDPSRQTLMAFAGASAALFEVMAAWFGCARHFLTVNRRCSLAVIEACPFRGNMVALDGAPLGNVGTMKYESVIDAISKGEYATAAVLSETNAPLVTLGLHLLTNGVSVQMRADKLAGKILNAMWDFKDSRFHKVGTIANKIRHARRDAIAQAKEDGEEISAEMGREDVINCIAALELFCIKKGIMKARVIRLRGGGWDITHPVLLALKMLTDSGKGVTLATGHVSKGLEWPVVFHLPGKMKAPKQEWQVEQNRCLAHVIGSRAKLEFYTLEVPEKTGEAEDEEGEAGGDAD